jgi:hypothetical protein
MNRQYNIRQRTIEVSTQHPQDIPADAMLLPWRGADTGDRSAGLLAKAGPLVQDEITEYGDERHVMLTSAGNLQVRFLFHLTLPDGEEDVDLDIVEERFRDCFFQAGVLGLSDLVIPITEFSSITGDFAGLVARIWQACSEFIARERGPRLIHFLVDDRDLRGQYLRHFFKRKQSEDHSWDQLPAHEVIPAPVKGNVVMLDKALPVRIKNSREKVVTLTADQPDLLLDHLDRLLDSYEAGDGPGPELDLLGPLMSDLLTASLPAGEAHQPLSPKLRFLGSPPLYRIPWELIQGKNGFLGHDHLITRGTNFLHFSRKGGYRGRGNRVSFRIAGDPEQAKGLAEEFRSLCKHQQADLNWSGDQGESVRLVHCVGPGMMENLVQESDLDCEMIFLDIRAGERLARGVREQLDEWAGYLLAHGCRRVLAPLTAFRTEEERTVFRQVFYKRVLDGSSAGEALHAAQAALRDRFGSLGGWFIYRLCGQTDDSLLPDVRKQQLELGEKVPG